MTIPEPANLINPNKPPMIFLPGKLCDIRVWESQIQAVSHLVTPIYVDLRYQDTLADMLQAISLACEQPFILAGFSLGGYVAQEFILQYPEKVSALALVGCSAKGYTEQEKHDYQSLIEFVINNKVNVMSGNSLPAYMHPVHYQDKQLVQRIENMLNDSGNDVYIRQQTATLNRLNRFEDLAQLKCPAIIVGGAEDKIVNLADVELTAKKPNFMKKWCPRQESNL